MVHSVDLLHVVSARAAAPRPSSGAIVRHWRHRQPPPCGGGLPDASIRLAGASAPAPARLHQRRRRRPAPRAPQPPPAPALPPPHPLAARILHLHVSRILNSNRSSSRFDQFQLPMTSFVCSCHWPPTIAAMCLRRVFLAQVAVGYVGLLTSLSSSSSYSSSDVCVSPFSCVCEPFFRVCVSPFSLFIR